MVFSETQPDQVFEILEGAVCLPDQTCVSGPNSPCFILYSAHSNFYYDTVEFPFIYEITPNQNDTIRLTVINNNGDVAYYENEPLLATANFNTTALNVYPNPVAEKLFVGNSSSLVEAISIFSLQGKLVFSTKNTPQIDMTSLPSGLYLVEIIADGKTSFKNVVKK